MRKLKPILKDRRKVSVPEELRQSLSEVFELIKQAKHDPDIHLGYSDAIQAGAVSGGKYGSKQRPFVFSYYPENNHEKGRWELTLHRTEIEDIGDGQMTEIMMYCCVSTDCECKFREQDSHCFYCDYIEE